MFHVDSTYDQALRHKYFTRFIATTARSMSKEPLTNEEFELIQQNPVTKESIDEVIAIYGSPLKPREAA